MGGLKVNFAEIEGGFEPVPEGRYDVTVERVEVRESKSSDYDYLNWELNIADGDYEGQKLWMITSLSPRALFRLKDTFIALEVIEGDEEDFELDWDDEVDITPQEGPIVTNPDLEGIAAVAVVKNEMYDGKERNRVDDLLGSDAGTSEPDEKPARKSSGGGRKSSSNSKGSSKSSSKKSGGRKRSLR
jgi:hypothetical protein